MFHMPLPLDLMTILHGPALSSPLWMPIVVAAYCVGRKTISAWIVVVFAACELAAFFAMHWFLAVPDDRWNLIWTSVALIALGLLMLGLLMRRRTSHDRP